MARSENLKQAYAEKLLLIKQHNVEQIELATQEMKRISLEAIAKLDQECNKEFLSYEQELRNFYKTSESDLDKVTMDMAEEIIRKVTNDPVNRKKIDKYNN